MEYEWHKEARTYFETIVHNLPQFHRTIAQRLVKEKSEILAQERGSCAVEPQDVIIAFFQEVPPAFKDMMKRLMTQHKIDYSQYVSE